MKKVCVLLLMVCLMGTMSFAEVLLNDTFADGSRTETSLPTESGFWASSAGDVTTTAGNVRLDMATSSRRMHTYFAPAGSPVSLNVGEQLIATIDFIPEVAFVASTSRQFRFGLFYNDTQYAQDGVGDSGVSNGWTDATGYAVQFGIMDTASVGLDRVGKRNSTTASLLGTDSAYLWGTNGTGAGNLSLDTVYTMTMVLDYQSAAEMLITFTFSDENGVITTSSLLDNQLGGTAVNTNFDFLLFRLSAAAGTAEVIDFQSITIEHIVPEPATLILLGLGGLMSLKRRRS